MGNQESGNRRSQYRSRTIQPRQLKNENSLRVSKLPQPKKDQSFDKKQKPSYNIQKSRRFEEENFESEASEEPSKNHRSIDYGRVERYSSANNKKEQDPTLDNLSKRNEELRRQLKKINDQLTEQLKKKKFVPKKKHEQNEDDYKARQNAGLKRELDNAYKQIQMYKRTIDNLKGRDQGDKAELKVSKLENDIVTMDGEINKYMKKIEGVKKIKGKQDHQIEKDINDDLKEGVAAYKQEVSNLKKRLLEYAARDRQREGNYKKQQAYLCDLERKLRQINGEYFPELKKNIKKETRKTTTVHDREYVNRNEFFALQEEANQVKERHEDYYRRINVFLQGKNKALDEQHDLKEEITYKEKIIEALKGKIDILKKVMKPRKKGLFGSNGEGSEMHSDYEDNVSEIQRMEKELQKQDNFDIKHLIANIPKPKRKRPQEISNGKSSDGSSDGKRSKRADPKLGGMVITNEKAEPKKWGSIQTRTEERGKHYKGELAFEDRMQFDGDVQPLIVGVNFWVNKNNVILAIQVIYLNKDELRYGVKSSEAADGLTKRFDLQSPDYLKNVTFTLGPEGFIEYISLYSKEGRVGKFGNKREYQQTYNFGLSSNERPYMFFGASSLYEAEPRLHALGIQICTDD